MNHTKYTLHAEPDTQPTEQIMIRAPLGLRAELQALAIKNHRSMNQEAIVALKAAVKRGATE